MTHQISDAEILEMIVQEILKVDIHEARLFNRHGKELKPYLIGGGRDRDARRFAFGLSFGPRSARRRRTIVRARLVYLAGRRDIIPPGYVIHHVDEDRHNDAWANLVMVTEADHLKLQWLRPGRCR